jgi:imidazolonepropionase-like amidohydrolase
MNRLLCALVLACFGLALFPMAQPSRTITIRAGRLLDGRGASAGNVVITIDGDKISSVGSAEGSVSYDLSGLTVLPGFIDTHVHILWHFGRNGRFDDNGESADDRLTAGIENARATVMSGFTTVQSVGESGDLELRARLTRDQLPGPRILTSVRQINERTGAGRGSTSLATPEQLRQAIRDTKLAGADLIKLCASGSIRDGGHQTMTDEQLSAACGEAKALNLRTLVHAHSAQAIRAAVLAGCSQIEHGTFATNELLKLMAERGTYFDPNIGVVLQNYLQNR